MKSGKFLKESLARRMWDEIRIRCANDAGNHFVVDAGSTFGADAWIAFGNDAWIRCANDAGNQLR